MTTKKTSPILNSAVPDNDNLNRQGDMASAIKTIDKNNRDRYTNLLVKDVDDLNATFETQELPH